jgi:hypothetical protein
MKNNLNLNPIKPGLLSQAERKNFSLTADLRGIMVGLLLGAAHAQKRSRNTNIFFEQSIVRKDYLMHLYELFKLFCISEPKLSVRAPSKIRGNVYSSLRFQTMALPCFNEFHELFFQQGPKIIPLNIKDLFTPLTLAYWICDDGTFDNKTQAIILCTECFNLEGVKLLQDVLVDKFKLNCTLNTRGSGHRIRIHKKSIPAVQALLKDVMPPMMMYKIGLPSQD